MTQSIKLIYLYYQVCDMYHSYLETNVVRFNSNKQEGQITDQELLCIYLFCTIEEEKFQKKSMHKCILNHWHSWFPNLPSYQTFNDRMNRLAPVFPVILIGILEQLNLPSNPNILLGDSLPIITCSAKRKPKVANHMVSKDYCASKNLWYYGLRLHSLAAQSLQNSLPHPIYLQIQTAAQHDLEAMRPVLDNVENAIIALDKAYCDQPLKKRLIEQNNTLLFTPEKIQKGESVWQKQDRKAYRDVLNTAVARIRQPIESLFSWLDRKVGLQKASTVRSEKGLLLHVYAKVAAAFMSKLPMFNP